MQDRPFVAVNCIIFGFDQQEETLKLLLIRNLIEPGKNSWSLVSGTLNTNETIDQAANRILLGLTGLSDIYLEQLHVFSAVQPDPEPRTIAVAYYAVINLTAGNIDKQYSAHWLNLYDKPKLIFDHDKMVENAVRRLRYRANTQPVGFKLLPDKFTMRQLQKLYEAIFGVPLDKRNFVKKINSLGVLTKLQEKETRSSRKGSYLFKFNPKQLNGQFEKVVIFK